MTSFDDQDPGPPTFIFTNPLDGLNQTGTSEAVGLNDRVAISAGNSADVSDIVDE